jgi:hypothetical protein
MINHKEINAVAAEHGLKDTQVEKDYSVGCCLPFQKMPCSRNAWYLLAMVMLFEGLANFGN